MRSLRLRSGQAVLGCALAAWLAGATPAAMSANDRSRPDDPALRELLEGKSGRRETWVTVPALVVMSSVLDYNRGNMNAGFETTDEQLTPLELTTLKADLTKALDDLTGGAIKAFRTIEVEATKPGEIGRVIRPGHIVAGRFRGVQAATGNLGYGGRMTRDDGTITGAVVMLDALADREAARRRWMGTHELGHAIGYNHVESRPSIMNPRVGTSLTDFDRKAMHAAFVDGPTRR